MHPAIFLDRDGVLIENCPNYVRSWKDVSIFPEAFQAVVRLASSPYKIVIVTNQSVVGRGFLSFEDAQAINQRLVQEIQQAGGRVDGVFMCPHAPVAGCSCRKPLPGLLLDAARTLGLDLSRSYMIGDAITDLQAGQAAGVSQAVLVRTGRGASQEKLASAASLSPYAVYDNLVDALNELVGPLQT